MLSGLQIQYLAHYRAKAELERLFWTKFLGYIRLKYSDGWSVRQSIYPFNSRLRSEEKNINKSNYIFCIRTIFSPSNLLYTGCLIILRILFTIFPYIALFTTFPKKKNFLEQHVYNNMLFMSLSLD